MPRLVLIFLTLIAISGIVFSNSAFGDCNDWGYDFYPDYYDIARTPHGGFVEVELDESNLSTAKFTELGGWGMKLEATCAFGVGEEAHCSYYASMPFRSDAGPDMQIPAKIDGRVWWKTKVGQYLGVGVEAVARIKIELLDTVTKRVIGYDQFLEIDCGSIASAWCGDSKEGEAPFHFEWDALSGRCYEFRVYAEVKTSGYLTGTVVADLDWVHTDWGLNFGTPEAIPVAALPTTWGQIKSVYR